MGSFTLPQIPNPTNKIEMRRNTKTPYHLSWEKGENHKHEKSQYKIIIFAEFI